MGKQQIPVGNYLPHDAFLRNLVSVLPLGGPPPLAPTSSLAEEIPSNVKKCQESKDLPVSGKPPAPLNVCLSYTKQYWSNIG